MTAKDKELESISKIIKELESIEEDRRSAVLKYVIERMSINVPIGISKIDIPEGPNPPNDEQGCIKGSIKEFINQKNPKNNYQLIACLGYFMEKCQGIREFGTKEITAATADARKPTITNVPQYLSDSMRKLKLLRNGMKDKRKKMLTSLGEKVVLALPNENEVKQILRKEKTSSSKKKKTKK